jgi:hypothetical protein
VAFDCNSLRTTCPITENILLAKTNPREAPRKVPFLICLFLLVDSAKPNAKLPRLVFQWKASKSLNKHPLIPLKKITIYVAGRLRLLINVWLDHNSKRATLILPQLGLCLLVILQ